MLTDTERTGGLTAREMGGQKNKHDHVYMRYFLAYFAQNA
jgi:hypothetical protein